MNADELKSTAKNQIPEKAKTLSAFDIAFLVDTLSEKDDVLRYNAFLLLQAYSGNSASVYKYWEVLVGKLSSDNSYQRSLGLMLLAENVRWDSEGKFAKSIDQYLKCCTDEKFITARQAIQGLAKIIAATNKYNGKIKQALCSITFTQYKDNQQKLLKKDVESILLKIK